MPKVFISYSHDSETHKARVLALAQALRRHGVEVELDQFHTHRIVDWPRWCREQMQKADIVLCICTADYRDRINRDAPPEEGKGVYWEGTLLIKEFYRQKGNDRFLPVLLAPESEDSIPEFLQNETYCQLTNFDKSDAGYVQLYRILTDQPAAIPEPVGAILAMDKPEHPAHESHAKQTPEKSTTTNVTATSIKKPLLRAKAALSAAAIIAIIAITIWTWNTWQTAVRYEQEADQRYDRTDFSGARDLYLRACNTWQSDAACLKRDQAEVADLLYGLHDNLPDESELKFKALSLRQRSQGNPRTALLSAQFDYNNDAIDSALHQLLAQASNLENNAQAHFLFGVIFDRKHDSESARTHYQKAAILDSSAPQYKGNLASSELHLDDSKTTRLKAQKVFADILDSNRPYMLAAVEWLRLELLRDGGPDWPAVEARIATGNRWLRDIPAMNQPWNLNYWRFPDRSGESQRLYFNGDKDHPRDDRQCYWFALTQLARYLHDPNTPLGWPQACTESQPARAVLDADINHIEHTHPEWRPRLKAAATGFELPNDTDL